MRAEAAAFPLWAWLAFAGLVIGLLALDLFVIHRKAREVPLREAMWMTAFWISVSLAFGGFVWAVGGREAAGEYLTAYLIEKSLSLDNVFVFAVIFASFAVPKRDRYHVLFYGVLGAIVFRLIFVLAGTALLAAFAWLVFVFGAFLVVTGLRMMRRTHPATEPNENRGLRLLRRVIPVTRDYEGDSFLVRRGEKLWATPLLLVLVVVESADVIFAIDSVPAVLAITQSTFVAYSAIVFAVLGLRALYFALEGLIDRFVYLHYGLAAILVFLGSEFVLQGVHVHIPIPVTLTVIVTTITVAILGSLLATRAGRTGGEDTPPNHAEQPSRSSGPGDDAEQAGGVEDRGRDLAAAGAAAPRLRSKP